MTLPIGVNDASETFTLARRLPAISHTTPASERTSRAHLEMTQKSAGHPDRAHGCASTESRFP